MAHKPLLVLLGSGDHEKIQLAAMVASVAAVSERPVQLLVSMGAIFPFARDLIPSQRYRDNKEYCFIETGMNTGTYVWFN